MCDLAGSERTNRTKADGDRLKEAGNYLLIFESVCFTWFPRGTVEQVQFVDTRLLE